MTRVRSSEAAAILGVSRRTVQSMTARGMIPGAAQIGAIWTYDAAKLRAFADRATRAGLSPGSFAEQIDRELAETFAAPIRNDTHDGPRQRVYVTGYGPYIKIGFSGSEKGSRIKSLQTGTPEKLEVIAHLVGGRALEKALHAKFKAYRLRGEWFKKRGALSRWITAGCPMPKGMERL